MRTANAVNGIRRDFSRSVGKIEGLKDEYKLSRVSDRTVMKEVVLWWMPLRWYPGFPRYRQSYEQGISCAIDLPLRAENKPTCRYVLGVILATAGNKVTRWTR